MSIRNIYCYKIPFLDSSYTNVCDFNSYEEQFNFYNQYKLFEIECNVKYDTNRTEVTIKKPYLEAKQVDYILIEETGGQNYWYFVEDREVQNDNITTLFLTLDVWSTYHINNRYMNSFVERCHVPRWDNNGRPTKHLLDEGLDTGELILKETETIYNFTESIIVASSVPIGKISTGGGGGGGDWEQGVPTVDLFRFLKGYEAYAPYSYQDSGGYWTIGYGVTLHSEPDLYNELKALEPVPEQKCAEVMWDLLKLNYAQPIVSACQNLGITQQQQFDALTSLAYNSGTGSITGNNQLTTAIQQDPLNEDKIRPIWENFKVTSGGVPQPGLVLRRKAECNIYFQNSFEMRDIPVLNSSGAIVGTVTENDGNGWLPSA